jgi:peptide/nickel transport system substrate-binding protein
VSSINTLGEKGWWLAVLFAAALWVAGCTPVRIDRVGSPASPVPGTATATTEPTAVPTATEPAPTPGARNVIVAVAEEPGGFDPQLSVAPSSLEITQYVYDTLVRLDGTGALQPGLAESWEAGDGGQTWTFRLKKGIPFDNGRELVAQDVAYSLGRLIDPATASPRTKDYGLIDSITVSDTYTVTLHLKEADETLGFDLTNEWTAIVPEEAADQLYEHPVGTGPFRIREWRKGNYVAMERSQQSATSPAPAVDEVVFRVIPQEADRVAALRAGQVDIVAGLSLTATQQLRGDPNIVLAQAPSQQVKVLAFNQARPPFDDRRVRQAFCHGIDRQAVIAAVWQGLALPTGSELAPRMPYYADQLADCPYDVNKAKALLGEAGHAQGLSVVLSVPPDDEYARMAQEVTRQLAEIGVQVQSQPVDWVVFLNQVYFGRDFSLVTMSHKGKRDPVASLERYTSDSQWNYLGYRNPDYDALVKKAAEAATEDERRSMFAELQRMLADDAVAVYLAAPLTTVAVRRNIKGCVVSGAGDCDLRRVSKE